MSRSKSTDIHTKSLWREKAHPSRVSSTWRTPGKHLEKWSVTWKFLRMKITWKTPGKIIFTLYATKKCRTQNFKSTRKKCRSANFLIYLPKSLITSGYRINTAKNVDSHTVNLSNQHDKKVSNQCDKLFPLTRLLFSWMFTLWNESQFLYHPKYFLNGFLLYINQTYPDSAVVWHALNH